MSYPEKKTLTSIVAGMFVFVAYCLYAFHPARLAWITAGGLKQWAITMLVFIGIGVVFMIVIQIVFHILFSISVAVEEKIRNQDTSDASIENNIKFEMVEDERDRLIELKANRVGFAVAGMGFIAALVSLVLNYSPAVMLNILFLASLGGSLIEGIAQLLYYRSGRLHA